MTLPSRRVGVVWRTTGRSGASSMATTLRASRVVVACDGSGVAISRRTLFLRLDRRTSHATTMRAMIAVRPTPAPTSGCDGRVSEAGAAALCGGTERPSGGGADAGAAGTSGVTLAGLPAGCDWTGRGSAMCGVASAGSNSAGATGGADAGAGGKTMALVGTQNDPGRLRSLGRLCRSGRCGRGRPPPKRSLARSSRIALWRWSLRPRRYRDASGLRRH